MDVSIIIPAHNAEKYLSECLDSVLGQSFSAESEIILINDGSNDSTEFICKEYVKLYTDRIIYFELKENKGVSSARNMGLDLASGEYFTFLDADDVLPVDSIQMMYDVAERNKNDIVMGGVLKINNDKKPLNLFTVKKNLRLKGDRIVITLLEQRKAKGYVCGKLFKNKKNVRFKGDLSFCEDLLFCVQYFLLSESLTIMTETVYHYRLHESSATYNKYKKSLYIDWLESIDLIGESIDNPNFQKPYFRLKVKTIHQLVRELRHVNQEDVPAILKIILKKITLWRVSYRGLVSSRLFFPRDFLMIIQINYILRKLSANLNMP